MAAARAIRGARTTKLYNASLRALIGFADGPDWAWERRVRARNRDEQTLRVALEDALRAVIAWDDLARGYRHALVAPLLTDLPLLDPFDRP